MVYTSVWWHKGGRQSSLFPMTCKSSVSMLQPSVWDTIVDIFRTPYESVLPRTTDGPSSAAISGVDVVTAGKMYNFHCSASCYPACHLTWTWGNETSQGLEFSLQLGEVYPTENLTCTAVNPATGMSVAAQKMLEVTGKGIKQHCA